MDVCSTIPVWWDWPWEVVSCLLHFGFKPGKNSCLDQDNLSGYTQTILADFVVFMSASLGVLSVMSSLPGDCRSPLQGLEKERREIQNLYQSKLMGGEGGMGLVSTVCVWCQVRLDVSYLFLVWLFWFSPSQNAEAHPVCRRHRLTLTELMPIAWQRLTKYQLLVKNILSSYKKHWEELNGGYTHTPSCQCVCGCVC